MLNQISGLGFTFATSISGSRIVHTLRSWNSLRCGLGSIVPRALVSVSSIIVLIEVIKYAFGGELLSGRKKILSGGAKYVNFRQVL